MAVNSTCTCKRGIVVLAVFQHWQISGILKEAPSMSLQCCSIHLDSYIRENSDCPVEKCAFLLL